jgi:hypothetical protein
MRSNFAGLGEDFGALEERQTLSSLPAADAFSLSGMVERGALSAPAPPPMAQQPAPLPPSVVSLAATQDPPPPPLPAAAPMPEKRGRGRPRRVVVPREDDEDGDGEDWTGGSARRSRRKSDGVVGDEEDGEFEVPRSLRYPRGSSKSLKRAGSDEGFAPASSVVSSVMSGSRVRRSKFPQQGSHELTLQDCERILELLERDDSIGPFLEPVDCVEYSDYLTIVSWPMDLSKIRLRLDGVLHPKKEGGEQEDSKDAQQVQEQHHQQQQVEEKVESSKPAVPSLSSLSSPPPPPPPPMMVQGSNVVVPKAAQSTSDTYTPANFCRDVRLVWSNCLLYNRRGTPIYKLAKHFSAQFEELLAQSYQGQDLATLQVEPAPQMLQRARRQGRAAEKSYNEDDYADWWDDSDDPKAVTIDKKKERLEAGAVLTSEEKRVDKILASRICATSSKNEESAVESTGVKEEHAEEASGGVGSAAAAAAAGGGGGGGAAAVAAAAYGNKEYFVKWEGMSYLHCEWVPHSRIARQRQKVRRYEAQLAQNKEQGIEEPEEPFDPRYTEAQRVIDYQKDADGVEWFMVKWEELPYSECTWESREDINDDVKIAEFFKWNKVPHPPPGRPESKSHTNLAQGLNYANGNELRSYQLEGLNWLIYNWYQRRGSILADEMGLGKTIQAVSFLHYLREREHIPGPFMVACNLSTLEHWYREIREWTDLNVVVYYGSREDRAVIREHEFFFKNEKGHIVSPHMRKAQVVLTTYDMVTAEDWEELRIIRWACIIVDEAQRMKVFTFALFYFFLNFFFFFFFFQGSFQQVSGQHDQHGL